MTFIQPIKHLFFFIILTIFTQVGGLIWLLAAFISFKIKKKKRHIFPILYLVFNLLIIPPLAQTFGRVPLPVLNKNLTPRNYVYPLLFRNYVSPTLKHELEQAAHVLNKKNLSITYLDANFPFLNGFPLLPHLSHNDGKKVDISFMYLDEKGNPSNKKPTVSGYGAYVTQDSKASQYCLEKGYWQYDFPRYLTFGTVNNLKLDDKNTKQLIKLLLSSSRTEKIFIEPYLKKQLNLSSKNKIRFHGCKAVRHDDHIHFQIR